MIKSIDRIPLSSIELLEAPLSPLKTHVKILKQKLPADFFTKKPVSQQFGATRNLSRLPPSTSSFPRKLLRQESPSRDTLTARDHSCNNRDEQLIMGILKSAREIKKVFRKHSVELGRPRVISRRVNQFQLELPPLLVKKGAAPLF